MFPDKPQAAPDHDTSSSDRIAQSSTHFICRPAARPAHLVTDAALPPDPRLCQLPDQLARALAARLLFTGASTFGQITREQSRTVLRDWCLHDLGPALVNVDLDATTAIMTRLPQHLPAWKRWLTGHIGDAAALSDLCWLLRLHPRTIGALERLTKRM